VRPADGFAAPLLSRLEGRRVVLEPLAAGHAEGLWEAAQPPGTFRFFTDLVAASREVFDAWLALALENARAGIEAPFATLDADTGRPLGSTRFLTLRPEHRGLEIGSTWVTPPAWGTGANTEAKYLMLEHAFERAGALRVEFKTEAANERSRAALAGIGASFEGVFRRHMLVRGGERRDSAWYAVIDEDWPRVRAALRARLRYPR
jgi:RimJ/RimL family protein N-acetyltransferase